jgi:hypothetical protein
VILAWRMTGRGRVEPVAASATANAYSRAEAAGGHRQLSRLSLAKQAGQYIRRSGSRRQLRATIRKAPQ